MNHNFYIPEEPYNNLVQSVWQVDHRPFFTQEYIVPKGVIEIIFNFSNGSPIAMQQNGNHGYLPRCFINGFNRTPITLQLPEQHIFFGIVFQPLAIRKIFGYAAAEFSDSTIDATLVDTTFGSLWQQLTDEPAFSKRVGVLLQWLQMKQVIWQPQEQLVNRFLYAAGQHHLQVNELAAKLCYSPRQLSRKILEASGMNTEEMLLYKKYLHAVELMHTTHLSLTAIAYQCHFADQSHFIKAFKLFTQMTPGAYRRSKSPVKGHLYSNVR